MKTTNLFLAAGIFLAGVAQSSSQSLSTVQFAALTYSVSETGGVAIITVERIGEPAGTALVEYSTSNGTATDGQDYTGQSGLLRFIGETNLTIVIPIINDPLAEGDETVLVTLSWWDPIDTQLGGCGRAVLVIRDEDGPQSPVPPLTRWHHRQPCLTSEDLRSVVYGNGQFVAVGDRGAIVTSKDGVRWFLANSGTSAWLTDVAYGNGVFVAVGGGVDGQSGLLSSSDGMQWTQASCGEDFCHGTAVTHGNGLFVAVGGQGGFLTSSNGSDWQSENSGVDTTIRDIAYGNGKFLAVGGAIFGIGDDVVLTSSDGRTWQRSGFDAGVHQSEGAPAIVVYGNGRFALVYRWDCGGCLEFWQHDDYLFTSSNGVDWTLQMSWHESCPRCFSGGGSSLGQLTYGDGLFVSHVSGGAELFGNLVNELILSSELSSGTDHTFSGPPDGLISLCIANHTIVGVGAGGLIVQSDPLLRLAAKRDGLAMLEVSGPIGSWVRLEAADNPAQTNAWQVLETLSLTNSPQSWTDSQATNFAQRFYRATLLR